ncbi:MAG: diguanylate cyclase [Pseudomonadota bacterium]
MNPIDISKFEQIKATGNLPSPRGVALAIIRLAQREDASMAELARVVKSDPAFVGRLIKAANSVNTSPGRPVVSVRDALVVLGMPAVRNLALGFSLLSQYHRGACRNFDYRRFWSGSLAFALAFQALTMRTRAAAAEEAFSVGLLARVGELALATLFPTEYSEILGNAANEELQHLLRAEQRAFAMNHRDLTVAMLADWGIPRVFTDPVGHHELPDAATYPEGSRQYTLVHSLALGRHVARICVASEADRGALMSQLFVLGSRVGIDAEALNVLCDGVVRDWVEWGRVLNIMTVPLPPFEELAKPQRPAADALAPEEGGAAAALRVLVVEGDPAARFALRQVLEREGYEVHDAMDAQDGLRATLEVHPHIMVIDCANGVALTRALRQTRVGRGIYVLILTQVEDEERLVEAFEAGVDDYMTKPLRPRLLAARLRAGSRMVRMQEEIERDRENIRHFAAELAVTNRRLQEVALTDSLTGFPNRRYAMERIQQEWNLSCRTGRPLVAMVIDLDGFKQVNDTYGHDVGDAYLRQAAGAIRLGLRAQDVVCRTGGDEFLVICPDTELKPALVCAERVRKAVEATPIRSGLLQLKATLSIGVAVRADDMADAEALVKRADQGVYLAKQRGRNQIAAPQASG